MLVASLKAIAATAKLIHRVSFVTSYNLILIWLGSEFMEAL